MYMVILGTLLLVLKIFDLGPTANLPWWVVLAPFGLALVWWAWADSSGWTKRREIEKMEDKRRQRRANNLESLGLNERGGRAGGAARGYRDVQAQKIEEKRDEIRRRNKEVMTRSTRPAHLDAPGAERPDSHF